eukprot:scaffold10022_cov170-Amphora_coffeaeformis.AAC.2
MGSFSRGLADEGGAIPQDDNVTTTNTTVISNSTAVLIEAEEEHEYDAVTTLFLNLCLICCLMLAYYVKKWRMYSFPESTGALLVGAIIGGVARFSTENLTLFEFSPEVFFFVLLPPIIFEAGYSLDQKDFFANIGAITLFAMVGTIISTFVIGLGIFYTARLGLLGHSVDRENPMEALLFGALISAVDPVATLSIMGNADLKCDPLLYSLVFGESVLNDAIAISLFRTFALYYDPAGPNLTEAQIPSALLSFITVSALSIGVGVALGLVARIMALFFQGLVLSHYNSYNLSQTAHVASEQIFSTLATIAETAVFLYMGMGVFTGRFENYDACWLANRCRPRRKRISGPMQCVLWFAGLRGAIAFALAMNMPGPNGDVYATATLSICIFTTVVCGSLTEPMLTAFGMKMTGPPDEDMDSEEGMQLNRVSYDPRQHQQQEQQERANRDRKSYPLARRAGKHVYHGAKKLWKQFDDDVLKTYFGGSNSSPGRDRSTSNGERGTYEMAMVDDSEGSENDSFMN